MRTLTTTACLLLLAGVCAAAAPAGVASLEPEMAAAAEQPDHGKVIIYFCGHCPGARKFMGTEVKALQDAVAASHAPLDIIALTPELEGEALRQYATAVGLDRIAIGHDGSNAKNISLKNILQVEFRPGPDGQWTRMGSSLGTLTAKAKDPAAHAALGSYSFDPAGITDPKLRELWWAIETGKPGAVAALAGARKKAKDDDPMGQQIIALYDAVAGALMPEIERRMTAGEDFATFEALEAAIQAAEGLDIRDAEKRLKELARDKQIKTELKARAAYRTCMEMLASPKDKDRQAATAGLAQLAEKMPDTVYGAKAAAR